MPVKEKENQGRVATVRPAAARPRVPGVRIGEQVREVRSELRKVVWPTREETIRLTGVVIGVCVVVGFFLGGVDFIFAELIRLILR